MTTVITNECINCAACEPECPNTAIYAAGIAYELGGVKGLPALSDEFFYIVPEKCTECVGFLDHEACAAVCPVDCCIPDPQRPEQEGVLMVRARTLHPEKIFAEPPPSRFSKVGSSGVAAAASPAAKVEPLPEPGPQAKAPAVEVAAAPKVSAAAENEATTKPAPPAVKKPEVAVAATAPETVSAAPAGPAPSSAKPEPVAAADSIADLEIPVLCRNCQVDYLVPFRLLSPGANLRCSHCRSSYSPTQEFYLLVGARVRRYVVDLDVAKSGQAGGPGAAKAEKATLLLRQSLDRDLRAVSAKLLSRPKSSWLGLS